MNISDINSLNSICKINNRKKKFKFKENNIKLKDNINSEITKYINEIKSNYNNNKNNVLKFHNILKINKFPKNNSSYINVPSNLLLSINEISYDECKSNKSLNFKKLIKESSQKNINKSFEIRNYKYIEGNMINLKKINNIKIKIYFKKIILEMNVSKNDNLKILKNKLIKILLKEYKNLIENKNLEYYNFKYYDEDNEDFYNNLPFLDENYKIKDSNINYFIFLKNKNNLNNYENFKKVLNNKNNILIKVHFEKFNVINAILIFDINDKITEIIKYYKKRIKTILIKDYYFKDYKNNIIPKHTKLNLIKGNEVFIFDIKYKDLPNSSINEKIIGLDNIIDNYKENIKISFRNLKKEENFKVNYLNENNIEKKAILSIDLKYIKLIDLNEEENKISCNILNLFGFYKNKNSKNIKRKIKDIKHINSINKKEFILIFEGLNGKEIIQKKFKSLNSPNILNRINQIKLNI